MIISTPSLLSGDAWDRSSEIGSPWSDAPVHTHHVQMEQLDLGEGEVLLYLFDYGDNHEFDVTVLSINPLAPKGEYPRVRDYHGKHRHSTRTLMKRQER
ncbi:MAG TPA: hypothetical protein VF177_20125 [Anaerolineae bacterium]